MFVSVVKNIRSGEGGDLYYGMNQEEQWFCYIYDRETEDGNVRPQAGENWRSRPISHTQTVDLGWVTTSESQLMYVLHFALLHIQKKESCALIHDDTIYRGVSS